MCSPFDVKYLMIAFLKLAPSLSQKGCSFEKEYLKGELVWRKKRKEMKEIMIYHKEWKMKKVVT